jgi:hypothetical protein
MCTCSSGSFSSLKSHVMSLKWLSPEFSPRKQGLGLRSDYVRSFVHKVALGYAFHRVPRFPPVSIIPPTCRTQLHLNVAPTCRAYGGSLGTFQKATGFQNRGEVLSLFFVSKSFTLFEMLSDAVIVSM